MSYHSIGYSAIIEQFNLSVMPHYRQSYISLNNQRYTRIDNVSQETHVYPKSYALKNPQNPIEQLEFAFKYDGINLEILLAVFEKLEIEEVKAAIVEHPTSKYRRILWFLYEFLTEKKLEISDADRLKYIDILDSERYFVSTGIRSTRHRINNNLLGNRDFCPIVRRSQVLVEQINMQYDLKAKTLVERYDPHVISRASHYLYTKETLSSYEIEREKPSQTRMNKFIDLLKQASSIAELSKERLIELQNIIVDPRFKDNNYRENQNYVGENINQYLQKIHYISPKPENVESLMKGLLQALKMLEKCQFHPVLIAAMISFGFVFIHPFEDGNGRIHRFLIHYILSKQNFTPAGIIFPISAVMLQNIFQYDTLLETFSKPLMNSIINYQLSEDGVLTVEQFTHNYYKYIDYTKMAEYLFGCINTTIHTHFENEIKFLINYDETKREIQDIVDIPDKLIDLFIKLVMQNHGELGNQKRIKYFDKLSDDEINQLLSIVKLHMFNKKGET